MPLLYAISEDHTHTAAPLKGVHEADILYIDVATPITEGSSATLRCHYSDFNPPPASEASDRARAAQDAALAFHRVLQSLLASTAIIPFRFPTLLPNVVAIQTFVRANHSSISLDLARVHHKIQMEVRLSPGQPPSGEFRSGTEFLKSRQAKLKLMEAAAAQVMEVCPAAEWKRRTAADGSIRIFGLLPLNTSPAATAESFRHQITSVSFNPHLTVRVSGPWPATEFITSTALSDSDLPGEASPQKEGSPDPLHNTEYFG